MDEKTKNATVLGIFFGGIFAIALEILKVFIENMHENTKAKEATLYILLVVLLTLLIITLYFEIRAYKKFPQFFGMILMFIVFGAIIFGIQHFGGGMENPFNKIIIFFYSISLFLYIFYRGFSFCIEKIFQK